jgi:hypothetical protein
MRNLILFLLISVSLFGQRKPSDVVDVNNFDYVYAEKLLHDKFVTELGKIFKDSTYFINEGINEIFYNYNGSYTKDSIAHKAIEYQLSHFKNGGKFGHRNTVMFRGVLLPFLDDRFYFFNNKKLNTNYSLICQEVCAYIPYTLNVRDTTKKQYYILDSVYLRENNDYRFKKTNKLNDTKTYFTWNEKEKCYSSEIKEELTYDDFTYEIVIDNIYKALMNSFKHKISILDAYQNNSKCYWKIIFKRTANNIEIWSGAFFYELN